MRRFWFTYFIFILLSVGSVGAQVFKGKVLHHSFEGKASENTPIAQAEVKADWANPTLTNSQGLFSLTFAGLEAGENIRLYLSKGDMEIVNERDLQTKIPKDPNRQHYHMLFMCPQGQLAKYRERYYNISEENIEKRYAERRAQLDKNNQAEIKKLEDEKANLLKQARELADRFARETFQDASDLYRKAFEAFQQGDIERAIQILNTVDSKKELEKAQRQSAKGQDLIEEGSKMKEEADSVIATHVKNQMFLAELYALDLQFDSAIVAYETAVFADTTNYDNIIDFAYFLDKLNRFTEATHWYEKALNLTGDSAQTAITLNNLGNLYAAQNRQQEAEKAYRRALEIYEEFAQKYPLTYQSDLGRTLVLLCSLEKERLENTWEAKHQEQGLAYAQRAIPLLEPYQQNAFAKQALEEASFFKRYFGSSLPAIKLDYYDTQLENTDDPKEKVKYQKELLALYAQAYKANPDEEKLRTDYADAYGNLAWYLLFTRSFGEAQQTAEKGLAIAPSQEWIHTILALAHLYQGHYEEAKAIYTWLADKPYGDGTYRHVFLEDLKALEEAGITHPDASKIRKILEK